MTGRVGIRWASAALSQCVRMVGCGWSSAGLHASTATGRADFAVGLSAHFVKTRLDFSRLAVTLEPCQAFIVAVQCPDIAGMLCTTRQTIADTKIVLVVDYCLIDVILFK